MPTLIRAPGRIAAPGARPRTIEEFVGRVNTQSDDVSIARMRRPFGWREPGQARELDEDAVVPRGMLRVETHDGAVQVARTARRISPDTVNRDP